MSQCTPKFLFLLILALLLPSAIVVPSEAPATKPPATTRSVRPRQGEVLRLQKDSITAMPLLPPRNNERSEPATYALDDKTRVLIGRLTSESTSPSGQRVQSIKIEPGTRDDLKVGRRVRIKADGDRAVEITIFPDPPEPKR